jgi:hypothetical protein
MKALGFLLAAILLHNSALLAQTNSVALNRSQAGEAPLKVHRTLMQRIFGTNVTYSGALAPRSKVRRTSAAFVGETFQNGMLPSASGRTEGIAALSVHY